MDGPAGKKRESKRAEKRKQASYLVRIKAIPRTPLSPAESKKLFDAIDARCSARFGLVKLSTLDLDDLHNPTSLAGGLVEWQPIISLLSYATFRSQHLIMIALLKAGADPSVRMNALTSKKIFTEGAQQHFRKFPTTYSLFLLEALLQMRQSGSLLPEVERQSCSLCGTELAQPLKSITCCQDVYCEACLWNYNISKSQQEEEALLASGAGTHGKVQTEVLEFSCPKCRKGLAKEATLPSEISTITKEESFEKWSALPTELPKIKPQKQKFKPLNFLESQSLFLGKTQSARNEEFWLAASQGFCTRLCCLMTAGAHLEAKNEYGQTALFLAAMGGYHKAVELLLNHGADPTPVDNAGVSPLLAAISLERTSTVQVLQNIKLTEHIAPKPSNPLNSPKMASLTTIVPLSSPHPGAGTSYIDNIFSESFLDYIDSIIQKLPISPPTKASCSDRAYFCDSTGWVSDVIGCAIRCFPQFKTNQIRIFPNMRVLMYSKAGGSLPAHVDLTRVDPCTTITSNHSFLLYLSNCESGGETVVLERLKGARTVIGRAQPKRGRLLVMPHACPHEGNVVETVPKILIRGEFY